jgi:hypothetical protein
MGEEITFGSRQTGYGKASADYPLVAYIERNYLPVRIRGHELCAWSCGGGIASLITKGELEKSPIQRSPDDINAEIASVRKDMMHAIRIDRTTYKKKELTEILQWGRAPIYNNGDNQSIKRFPLRRKNTIATKRSKLNSFYPKLC